MNESKLAQMVAPCGLDCSQCELVKAKDDPKLTAFLIAQGIPSEKIPCPGCRTIKGNCPVIGPICATFTCVTARSHRFCYECADFPCVKLQPTADQAKILPHNLKVFNLCCIERLGMDQFLTLSPAIRARYFRGKMAIGEGPQLPQDAP